MVWNEVMFSIEFGKRLTGIKIKVSVILVFITTKRIAISKTDIKKWKTTVSDLGAKKCGQKNNIVEQHNFLKSCVFNIQEYNFIKFLVVWPFFWKYNFDVSSLR